jgi:ABC-2 type transport system ATP-binding protein
MKDSNEPAIIVKNLSKTFKIPIEKSNGIKQALVNLTNNKKGYRNFKVLNDVSFEIKKGEFFGIVGRNGSGKSTLLKLLAGIYIPDSGLVKINGSLTPFIELGVGFNPELTAKENVYLNGALLGFSKNEVAKFYNEIIRFAELEDFMSEKLKNFSSGMQVRLAFSIAIRAESDILLMDEVLAVGDADFQKKCFNVFRRLKKEGRTIILVTHDMGNVEKFCDRVLVVDKGAILSVTTPSKAASIYARLNIDDTKPTELNGLEEETSRWGSGGIRVKSIIVESDDNKTSPILDFEDDLKLKIQLEKESAFKNIPFDIGLAFINQDNVTVAGPNSSLVSIDNDSDIITYILKKSPLQPGDYSVTVAVINRETNEPFDFYDRATSFHVISDSPAQGVVGLNGLWAGRKK